MSIDDLARASAQDVRAVARGRVDVPAGRVALARAVRNRHRRVVTGWVVVLAVVAMVLAGVTARDVLRRPAPAVPAPKIVRASGNGIILVRAGHVVAISPATGGTSPAQYGLLDKSDAHLVGWSPDGSKLAYVWANKLWVRDQQGRPVMSTQAPTLQMFEPLMWSADGGTFVGLSAGYQIWVKPLSGPARTVPVPEAQRRQLYWGWSASLSPNGRQIAFVAFTVIVALSLPGGLIMSLVCGFIFGRVLGTVLGVLAATAGATLLFLGARYLFADAARRRIGRLGARVDAGFAANAFHYVLFLRIAPVVPFFLANLALAFMSIPLRTYVVATFIGVIPGIFVYANLGQALGSIESLSGLLSLETLTALGLLGAFALAPVVLRAVRARATRSD